MRGLKVIQWRMVNHEEVKAFLGRAYIGKLNKASQIVLGAHHAHDITFHSKADGTGPQMYAPLNSYIVLTESGRLTPVDAEVYEHLTAQS